jgi:IS5 family transposase
MRQDSPSISLTGIRINRRLERAACIRARVEHVFVHQKSKMGLFIWTIGLMRAEAKIMLTNLACNMHRRLFLERREATA